MAGSYSLGEHFENFIKQQVASGLFNNESEDENLEELF